MSNPDPSLQACTEKRNVSKITVNRDGRRATFDNAEHARIMIVDLDCWISNPDIAMADYVVAKPGLVDVIVELKGKDIKHAVKQIESTLGMWKKTPPLSDKIGGLIVFTRSPLRSAEISDTKKRLLQKYGLWLEMDKDQKTEYRFETFTGAKS